MHEGCTRILLLKLSYGVSIKCVFHKLKKNILIVAEIFPLTIGTIVCHFLIQRTAIKMSCKGGSMDECSHCRSIGGYAIECLYFANRHDSG